MIFPRSALTGVFRVIFTIKKLSVYSCICRFVILVLTPSFPVNQDLDVIRYL